MGLTTGLKGVVDFATPVGDPAKVQALIDALPNPDAPRTTGTGAVQGGISWLDEISPIAAAQLKVELTALKAAVT